jgi:hypothetical protein
VRLSALQGWEVETVGVEMRSDLVAEMNQIAAGLDGFSGLRFECSSVAQFLGKAISGTQQHSDLSDQAISGTQQHSDLSVAPFLDQRRVSARAKGSELDVLIALHACDIATDDALWCGITNGARIIVVAPCCHKEVRQQLELGRSSQASSRAWGGALGDTSLRYGIYRERTAEMVTDSLRALLLEIAGYVIATDEP